MQEALAGLSFQVKQRMVGQASQLGSGMANRRPVVMARSSLSSAATGFGMVTLKHTEDFGIAFPTVERVLSSDLSPPP